MDFVDNYLIQPAISAVFNFVIEQIVSEPIQRFLDGRKTTRDWLGQLKHTMLALNAVVADAEQKAITNELVKLWFDELKDAMYDVETLLDAIATRALQSTVEGADAPPESSSIKKVLSSISTFQRQPDHEKVDSTISDMCKRLDGFLQQISILGLQVGRTGEHSSRGKKPATTSLLDQSMQYVGRDSEVEEVIRFLQYEELTGADQTGEQSQKRKKIESGNYVICIIAIVGMPGVGKTTLAQLLYNDGRLDEMFDLKAWLHLPRDFTTALVFKTICELLCEETLRSDNLELIQKKLCKMIRGKKFLLVFDDVWIEHFQSWDELIRPVKTAGRGTTIIVTTQNANIAIWMHANHMINLNPFSDEECWSVIRSIALDSQLKLHEHLEVIGRQIATKCRGLPLAAVVLGGALRSIPEDAEKWVVVLRSPIWEIPDALYGILPALRLSYDYLPHPQIKRCFAYCALFPKNHGFQKEELVLLWMAEGFISPSQSHTTMEQLGSSYFDELISRSFFQQMGSSTNLFVMHDLIHDLAINVFGRFGLLPNSNDRFNLRRARHFSFLQTKYHDSERLQVLFNHNLWTFLALGSGSGGSPCYLRTRAPTSELPTCTSLRVLSMPHYQVAYIIPSIGNLKHLRYLNFSSTPVTCLPETISMLYNLQTLLLSNCYNLQSLPAKLANMVSLRHLDISNTKMLQVMPPHIGRLTNLQTLSKFVVGWNSRESIAELNQLSLQGILLISRLENVVSDLDAGTSNMSEKPHLVETVYEWSGPSRNQYRILDKLKPHINLKRLTIRGFCEERFPGWVGAAEYCNLVALHLKDCFKCISLPPLGQLPSLKHLFITGFMMIREVGHNFYGNNSSSSFTPFPSLEILKFGNMPLWYSWSAFEGDGPAFPQLQQLFLLSCKILPSVLPLNIPSLRRLAIVDCGIEGSLQLPPSLDTLEISPLSGIHKTVCASLELAPLRKLKIAQNYTGLRFFGMKKEVGFITISPSVQELEILNCTFKPIFRLPPWLTSLSMDRVENVEFEAQCFASLQCLCLSRASIRSLCFELFPKLISLEIASCCKLSCFLVSEGYLLESLCDLSICDCRSLLEFPPGGLPAPNLTTFTISGCHRLRSLPERMYCSMTSLKFLSVGDCPEIGSFPHGGLPSNLHTLKIHGCYKLTPVQEDWQLPKVLSLMNLEIVERGCKDTSESFPNSEGLLPTSLTSLSIKGFKSIKFLNGKAFQHLVSLQELKISECPLLKCLPEDGIPQSLCSLEIYACPLLQQRCHKTGEDWTKISHLPRINNHGEEI